jgi:type VI secretion system protein ImpA
LPRILVLDTQLISLKIPSRKKEETMQAINELSDPVNDLRPSGEDLCFSADFDAIAQARRFDDPSIDQGEWVTDLKEADWKFVVDRCALLLRTRSKDLRLAVWYTEANAKVEAFAGLANGYRLIAMLCDQFWETMYPVPEDGDNEQRVGNLAWLLTRSAQLMREMPLTEGRDTAYSLADFEAARGRALQAEKALSEGLPPPAGVKLADMETARRKNSRRFTEKNMADAQACLDALAVMERAVDARMGADGPGFTHARETLDTVIAAIRRFAKDAGVKQVSPLPTTLVAHPSATADATMPLAASVLPVGAHGPIQDRNQALAQLRDVADFFRRTEPHSPVAYLADKAAEWGNLPLHAWLQTVIKDSASLSHVEELLGLAPRPGSGE